MNLDPALSSAVERDIDTRSHDAVAAYIDDLVQQKGWQAVAELWTAIYPAADSARRRAALRPIGDALAHRAPCALAARVLVDDQCPSGVPAYERIASRCLWSDLRNAAPDSGTRLLAAYERLLRGDDLRGDPSLDASVFGPPFALQPWEPKYHVLQFAPNFDAGEPGGSEPALSRVLSDRIVSPAESPDIRAALLRLTNDWGPADSFEARVGLAAGSLPAALAVALGPSRPVFAAEVAGPSIFAWIAAMAASDGVYGTRAGAAMGRIKLWQLLAALAGRTQLPYDLDAVASVAQGARWFELRSALETAERGLWFGAELADRNLACVLWATLYD